MQNILIIYYFAISQKFSKIVFENENLAIFTLIFFVKFDFEIAVDQQTRAHDQTFEGVPGGHRCPRDSHAHIWSIFAK